MLTFVIQSHRGVEQLVARRAHNPEAGGSSPSPATRTRMLRNQRPCFLMCVGHDTNLTGSNPVAGIYRQAKRMASRCQ